ncbi:hypothetical protein [Paraburkholderia fynbosensis]|uniref:Uncharacterized protein n=1 Tax=Paraburkholderia fynbosensis TaxID=1200993 RepID=A0A6J5GKM3_9BURK|nr:hypothetical protein [Paraburkholderia fynbosensis]CAB3799988.1 hypothetical protein LMG27177_04706 [Paraburkholderia fynbosensis]
MSADPILYCLENLTNYRVFERLCSALLAGVGYIAIDPLGGTGDEGRDAVIIPLEDGRKIVFAYTVRSDWRQKLRSDCNRVLEKGHGPDLFVFACTQALSASEKDWARELLAAEYGWKLDLFDIERMRVQLAGPQKHLLAQHPSIFTPPFFPQRGGQSISASHDTILIDHVPADHAAAAWLARRLTLAGYRTWCQGTAPVQGENVDDTVRQLIESRARLYLPFLSTSGLEDSAFLERCTIAGMREDFVVPCAGSGYVAGRLPSRIAKLEPASFTPSWNTGLQHVLQRLSSLGVPLSHEVERGRQIALRDYFPSSVTVPEPEPVFANAFAVKVPEAMLLFDLVKTLTKSEMSDLRKSWAFAIIHERRVAAFTHPPATAPIRRSARPSEVLWSHFPETEGRRTKNVATELIRRSLEVACYEKGLERCMSRDVLYFPAPKVGERKQTVRNVDGRTTWTQLTGQVQKGYGERASKFAYQLSPAFSPKQGPDGSWEVLLRIYVRVTTLEGVPFEGPEINRRRKIVTKSWWNQKWLRLLLGIVQSLETGPDTIQIGTGPRSVTMSTRPLMWECPVGLDVVALARAPDIGEEIAEYRSRDAEGTEDYAPSGERHEEA